MQKQEIIATFSLLKQQLEQYHEIEHAKSRSVDAPKQPKIPFWVPIALPYVFDAIKRGLLQINDTLFQRITVFSADNVEAIVLLLTDADKDNAAQLKAYLGKNWKTLVVEFLGIVGELITRYMPENGLKTVALVGIKQILDSLE